MFILKEKGTTLMTKRPAHVQCNLGSDYKGKTLTCHFNALLQGRAECQHKHFLLFFLGLPITLYLYKKRMYKGRFKKSKALGVVVNLTAVTAAVKIGTWALQEALGAQETLYTKPAYQSNAPGARAAGSQPASASPPAARESCTAAADCCVPVWSTWDCCVPVWSAATCGLLSEYLGSLESSSDFSCDFDSGEEMFSAAAYKHDLILTTAVDFCI